MKNWHETDNFYIDKSLKKGNNTDKTEQLKQYWQ
jgi:hypothetical protein